MTKNTIPTNIFIVAKLDNPNSSAVRSILHDIYEWANANDVLVIRQITPDEKDIGPSTLFVAIGGDGTVIYAAKQALDYDAMTLGFNLGKVGFLADFDSQHVHETLSAAFNGTLTTQERTIVRAQHGVDFFYALNDIVISCSQSDSTLSYDLSVNDGFAGRHTANGVIVSTATGSTAYALNVGGAILTPELDVIEIVPIAAQTMTSRPLIVAGDPGIAIKFAYTQDRPVSVRVDGSLAKEFNTSEPIPQFDTLSIRTGSRKVKLLHHHSWNHFDVLAKKLSWNK